MPSNFFGTFRVLVGDEVIYEGVRNEDWNAEGDELVLEIHETVDLACEQ